MTANTILAITLYQPYATLIAIGAKKYETRVWPTRYRGRLAIHAARVYGIEELFLRREQPFCDVLAAAGYPWGKDLPHGAILATCRLVEVYRTEDIAPRLSEQERAFGGYSAGRYAFKLDDVQRLAVPVPARGYQKLWDCTAILEGV